MTLPVTECDGAVQFAVKAVPGAARDRIVGLYGSALKVQVTAAPEGGKANARIAELLAAALGVPTRAVEVVQGLQSPRKVVRVAGIAADAVREKLAARPS